jgi:hypothetical protein
MRLHPSVGFTTPRLVPHGGDYIAGHFVPAGYRVGVNAAVVKYDTKRCRTGRCPVQSLQGGLRGTQR